MDDSYWDKKGNSLTFDDVFKMGPTKADKLLKRMIKTRISRNGKGSKQDILILEFEIMQRQQRRRK
jgi:hypothetical protein